MFGLGKDTGEEKKRADLVGIIGKGVFIEGRLSFDETVRIDGSFKGEVDARGTLVVGEFGVVEGEIKAGCVIVTGKLKGRVEAASRIEIASPGRLTGEIRTPTLIIGEGAVFEGNCVMVKKDAGAPEVFEYKAHDEPDAHEPEEAEPLPPPFMDDVKK